MKILYITTVGGMMAFFKSFIKTLIDEGHIVDIATNEDNVKVPNCYREWGCNVYQISCSRKPLKLANIKAIQQIKKIARNYDLVHCHSPIAAMCTRLACKKLRKNGLRVIYTAHGFHFYKGAPKKNWALYYPIEKICSKWTDVLITINKEDFELATKKFKSKKVEYVPGVGIDLDRFMNCKIDESLKRKELNIPDSAVIILSVGELNKNKNHEIIIKSIASLENIYYIIAGRGPLEDYLINLSKKLNIQERVKLLGFRDDVHELYAISDIFAFPSYREGLPVSIMEAMASGLPVICSRIRGNVDLINCKSGNFFEPNNLKSCEQSLKDMLNKDLEKIKNYNKQKSYFFSNDEINKIMKKIYFV